MAQFRAGVDLESLEFVINHVFLPPQLPQNTEEYTGNKNNALLQLLHQASDSYARNFSENSIWSAVDKLVQHFGMFENNTSVSAELFATAVKGLKDREAIGIHITSQNAGLILRRVENSVIFTSFEASPTSSAVTEAIGKLLISYPGPAVAVAWETVIDPTFLKRLSEFVEMMKRDQISAASGRGQKAGETVQEERESAHPMFISELLTGILRGVGQEANVERFMKRIGDEVLWDNAIIPWRRSPLWLVVRVALRMILGQEDYKSFMIFFMAQVLVLSTQRGVSADRLFVMNAKLARRVYKLRDQLPETVLAGAGTALSVACKNINDEWLRTQNSVRRDLRTLWRSVFFHGASFMKDTVITMRNSREYVKGLRHINCTKPEREAFTPKEVTRIHMNASKMPETAHFKDAGVTQDIMLADFERWVMESLGRWLAIFPVVNLIEACGALGGSMQDYMEVAIVAYQGNPERNSIMILTVMELWMALDKLAIDSCPLLSKYSPELNESFLCVLLLPQAQQRSRLSLIENYIKQRRSASLPMSTSVFSKDITKHTFSVCYFESCDDLVQLEKHISNDADIDRQNKIAELARREAEYHKALANIRMLECDYFTHWKDGWTRHDRYCKKCAKVKEAEMMKIEVHEWPLPDDPLLKAAVVFELRCPRPFAIWREATFRIRNDLCTPLNTQISPCSPFENISNYSGLKPYFADHKLSRQSTLRYTSMTKSFLSSHYRYRRLPARREEICVRNALQFALYDTKSGRWTSDLPRVIDCRHLCTFRLPRGPYSSLQYAVEGTSHTPNQVLAHQSKCPPELQLHEYVAFGLMRSGWRIQWLNMLRELRSRTLTFSAEPVSILYLQTAWQVGHSGNNEDGRECHIEPGEEDFGRRMIKELEILLEGVEENWQEVTTVQTVIVLAIQIMAATKSTYVRSKAVKLLKKARRVCLAWTRELAEKLPECDPGEVRESQLRVIQIAATCRMTFDVEERFLWVMLRTDDEVAVYVECATTIRDNLPSSGMITLPVGIKLLLSRDTRIAYAIEGHLRGLVCSRHDKAGIDLKPIWNAYERGTYFWSAMDSPNDRWVYTYTGGGDGKESQKVHYNLISGELLVEGLPLGRMPVLYTNHPAYRELFQEKVLNVYPSNMPGMIFQTRHAIYGYKVSFAIQEHENELIIRTEREEDGVFHQLVPSYKLCGDFPANIISSHVFWLELPSAAEKPSGNDFTTGKIELRDRKTPWDTKKHFYISYSYDELRTELKLGESPQLIDVRSGPANTIAAILAPLETAEFIQITYGLAIVRVHLPRLKLDFSVNRGNYLECKQFPNMVIDHDQKVGTFIGLQNLLVVRDRQRTVRSVIIPHGKILLENEGKHTKVKIDTTGMERVKYHVYTLNPILGTVVGNGSLTSHLYKVYLHAVTSHCLPDPFTRRTGTEEALLGLRAAATKSFQRVETDSVEADLFRRISDLTPIREYYPKHLKRMQQVRWIQGLSPLAQHDEFRKAVQEVSEYAELLNIFEDVSGSILFRNVGAEDLAHRAAKRNAVFRTEQFGGNLAEDKTDDRIYVARDMVDGSSEEARVAYVAQLVKKWRAPFNIHPNILNFLEGLGEIQGSVLREGEFKIELGYNHKWLEPDLAEVWITLYNGLREVGTSAERYDWLFLLTTLVYSGKVDLRIIETLLAFGAVEAFKTIEPPAHSSYNLRHGYEPDDETLYSIITSCAIDFSDSKESKLEGLPLESEYATQQRRSNTFNHNKEKQAKEIARELQLYWPGLEPSVADESYYPLYNVTDVLLAVEPWFKSWNRNSDLRDHISDVQRILKRINNNQKPVLCAYHFMPCVYSQSTRRNTIRLSDLLTRSPPTLPTPPNILARNPVARDSGADSKPKNGGVEDLLRDFKASQPGKFQKIYTQGLEKSIRAFQSGLAPPDSVDQVGGLVQKLMNLKLEAEEYMWNVYKAIEKQLQPKLLKGSFMTFQAGLWPRLCPILLLQQLATNHTIKLSPHWKVALITYGVAITTVQRLNRLIWMSPNDTSPDISSDFLKELENTGHQRWEPIHDPDWLLIEIENNFLIRPVQADIASKMIAPPGNTNTIMQLCMGEGKTSVIVPIVAASLADAKKLVRVVVLKPLSGQMFQTLVQKLGGLVNRRIFFMPFSRGISMGKEQIKVVNQLYDDCLKGRGILLVQPEHILSFKLLGLEWLHNSATDKEPGAAQLGRTVNKYDRQEAQLLLEKQKWLDTTSRDILDESDEILNVKHELIYTIGNPAPIQNHPDRWVIIQEIFDLIKEHFMGLETSVQEFELERHNDKRRFGSIRILNLEAGRDLLKQIAVKMVEDQLLTISFRLFPASMRALATRFITDTDMTGEEAAPLLRYFNKNSLTSDILYLLRGLIAHNILLFSLKEKRWKVDYGLDLKRSLLAVPYRAKDSPAGKAEFSHPDVAITLTCLSYYYGGLDNVQLETCFRNLHKSENPALQYERWIKGVDLPKPYLQRLNGINLEDRKQWENIIYPTFHFNKAVIDSYLSGVVFPKAAKEFPYKLSSSGWDIAGSKTYPTTGFSGTNDNRYLLPLTIKQLDTTEQLNTNARVLSYLLQDGNNYKCTAGGPKYNERISVEQLLKVLVNPGEGRQIQVLLDVGAQVLEFKNDEVAKRWLGLVSDGTAQAAVYFNDNDELTALTRDGNKEPLMVSAFAERLDSCLIYLDEAHTRGTDLKLPVKSRAAVTLGPNLTKDRLVQACMRMRKLGNGHTVMFCGPPEIDRQIMAIARERKRNTITVRDVLYWSMQETCHNTRKLLPIWAKQGINYQTHLAAWNDIGGGKEFPEGLLETESKTLTQHYGFERLREETIDSYRKPGAKDSDLSKIVDQCQSLGVKSFRGARMLEEQERELAHEVECERENQRPEQVGAAKHNVSDEVKQFISTGILPKSFRRSFIPAFSVLAKTSAKDIYQQSVFSEALLATSDFCKVVEGRPLKDNKTNDFLRPVNWIVSSTADTSILILMSPWEVNRLLPDLRTSTKVVLHMYSPQVTRSTPSYNSLSFCTIPRLPSVWQPNVSLIDELNIFAGQLYFPNYEAYQRVCGFLGLYLDETTPEKRSVIQSDGFVKASDRGKVEMQYKSPFETSPVTLVRELTGFRRKGQSYIATHMGHILHGRYLMEDDFEEQKSEEEEEEEDFEEQEWEEEDFGDQESEEEEEEEDFEDQESEEEEEEEDFEEQESEEEEDFEDQESEEEDDLEGLGLEEQLSALGLNYNIY